MSTSVQSLGAVAQTVLKLYAKGPPQKKTLDPYNSHYINPTAQSQCTQAHIP